MSSNTALKVTGGAGNDRITTASVLTTGSVDAGAGTADRLILAADAHVASQSLGNKYSNFEVIQLAAGATQDMSFLSTNNTVTGLRLVGSATVTNISAATSGDITVTANATLSLGVSGATSPGQLDTVTLKVTDEAAAVAVITLTTPTLAGVETLNLVATDSITIGSMANAPALTTVSITGAGVIDITTGAVATVTNTRYDASAGTGTFTFTAAASTGGNGMSITGSATKVNTITGTANADLIVGGSAADALFNQTTAVTATAGDVMTGGAGFDTFTLRGDVASGAVSTILATAPRITDFTVGATTTTTDFLSLNAAKANYSGAATNFHTGVAAAAAGSTSILSIAVNNGATAIAAGTDLIKLTTGGTTTGTLQAAFDAAIGSSTVTGVSTANNEIFFTLYDTTNSRMLVGIVDSGGNDIVATGDVVTLIGSVNMTAADYVIFSANSLTIV